MHVRSIRALLGASLLVALSACGDDSSGPTGLAPVTLMPAQYLETFGNTGVGIVDLGVNAMGFGGSNISLARGEAMSRVNATLGMTLSHFAGGKIAASILASPSCNPTVVGGATDTDGDGIPDDASVTYTQANCTVFDTATGDAQYIRGVYRIQDTGDALYGFKVTITGLHARNYTAATGDFSELNYNATETGDTKAGGATYHLVLDAAITQGDATGSTSQLVKYDFTQKLAPSGSIVYLDPLPNGAYTVSGSIDATLVDFGVPTRVVMSLVTPDPMSYTSGCGGVNSGEYEMRLNGSTTEGILVHFEGCSGYYEPLGAGNF